MRKWRFAYVLVAMAALLAVSAGAASAGPRDVVADWWVDGSIDGAYSISDLRGALKVETVVEGGGVYDNFVDAVNAKIAEELGGGRAPRAARDQTQNELPDRPGAGAPRAPLPADVPAPVASTPRDSLPTAFVILAAAAGGLLVVGVGTAAFRRFRRR